MPTVFQFKKKRERASPWVLEVVGALVQSHACQWLCVQDSRTLGMGTFQAFWDSMQNTQSYKVATLEIWLPTWGWEEGLCTILPWRDPILKQRAATITLTGAGTRVFDEQYPLGSRRDMKCLPKASDWGQTDMFIKKILSKGLLWPYASSWRNRDINKVCSLSWGS